MLGRLGFSGWKQRVPGAYALKSISRARRKFSSVVPCTCPLCRGTQTHFYFNDVRREYAQCASCRLVFVGPKDVLSLEAQKQRVSGGFWVQWRRLCYEDFLWDKANLARYDKHQNNPNDQGHRRFLNKLCEPVHQRTKNQSYGLDFGSGPGPTLSLMFKEKGHSMEIYDPIYADDKSVFGPAKFDFVTCTEVVEHLIDPFSELNLMWDCVKPGGILAIMTKLLDKGNFASWYYKDDPTHIRFFSEETFRWVGKQLGGDLEFIPTDVILINKRL